MQLALGSWQKEAFCIRRREFDNRGVVRRVHVRQVRSGEMLLDPREAHHIRDVLRLKEGAAVEVFDDAGQVAQGVLGRVINGEVSVIVGSVGTPATMPFRFSVASAVPKAGRGDWMVEKLSELGAEAFVPLATERSIVLPEGKNKLGRWQRLAEQAAKQSRRAGVMRIEPLTPMERAIENARAAGEAWHLTTARGAQSMREQIAGFKANHLMVFIGPEGGWSPTEIELFARSRIAGVSLTPTILRVETAAITAAGVIATMLFNPPAAP